MVSFGFPAQAPAGGHFGYATAGRLLPGGGAGQLLQMSEANDLTTGFSGGPIVDEVTGLVIGMVTSIAAPDAHLKGLGIAYATPAEVLCEVRPELAAVQQVCPYLGLEPFTAQHTAWFHGREAAVENLLAVLGEHRRMTLLLGPSGAGKSSLVKAGVLPALTDGAIPGSDRWLTVLARPGQDLLAELERAGLPGAATDGILASVEARLAAGPGHDRLLLVIDQFEELLAQPTGALHGQASDRRLNAAEQLVELNDSDVPVTVLLIMRDDFYAPLNALAPDLMNAALPGLLNVPATLSVPELHAIITRPAAAVGLPLEAGLADRIVGDLMDDAPTPRQAPATLLPPLELALRQMWERRSREDGRLTHAAYEKIGKVTGSMTAWCNTAVSRLPADHRPIARHILTALVRPADEPHGTPAIRQAVPVSRLRALATGLHRTGPGSETSFDPVLASLTRYRIITTGTSARPGAAPGEPTAELIHDSLIRDWSDLRDWVAKDRQFQLWLHRAAEQQARHARSGLPGDLLGGTLLQEGLDWADQRPLPDDITALLSDSRAHRQAAFRRTRRINRTLAGLLALALIAIGVATDQWRTATTAESEAVTAQHQAQSRQLAAQSANLVSSEPDLASLLAVLAWRTSPTDEAAAALYSAPAVPLLNRLTGHKGNVRAVVFSPDGKTLASSSEDGSVRIWDAKTGKTRATLKGLARWLNGLAFSPDGRTLAVGGEDGSFHLWDKDADKTRTIRTTVGGDAGYVNAAAFSPDGTTLAIGIGTQSAGGGVELWDVKSGKARATLKDHGDSVDAVAFSPDGKTLATSSAIHSVHLRDAKSGKTRTKLKGIDSVSSLAFSPDGKTLVGGNPESSMLWDVKSGKTRTAFKGAANAVAFSPDGKILAAAGSYDGSVRLWDIRSGKFRAVLKGHTGGVNSLGFSRDGKTLATGSNDDTVRLWDMEVGETRTTIDEDVLIAEAMAFSPDGKTLAFGGAAELGASRVWLRDAKSGKARSVFDINDEFVDSVAFSPDGKTLAVSSMDATVRLLDVNTGKIFAKLRGHDDGVNAVVFSPDGKTLATGSMDTTVRLWDVKSGKVRATIEDDVGISFLAFSPDGETLAATCADGSARVWDAKSGRTRAKIKSSDVYAMESVAFSPDGSTLAIGSGTDLGGGVRLWDVETGRTRAELKGQTGFARAVAFSPDGKILASGSSDSTVRLWDAKTGKARSTMNGDEFVMALAFSPDGKTLAVSYGSTVRLWNIDLRGPDVISNSICASMHRDITRDERSTYLSGQNSDPACPQ